MSRETYAIERWQRKVEKSYINGRWTPITALPKAKVLRSVKRGRFGQKHLAGVNEARNMTAAWTAGEYKNSRVASNVVGRVGRHNATTGLESKAGPHVIRPVAHGGKAHVSLMSSKSNPAMRKLGAGREQTGLKFHTRKAFINAHELEHANVNRRSGLSRTLAVQSKMMDQNPKVLSRIIGADSRGKRALKAEQKYRVVGTRANQKYLMGEEARADVRATRRLGSQAPLFSGHINDTGNPKDYLKARNRVERGMGIRRTKRREMYWKD